MRLVIPALLVFLSIGISHSQSEFYNGFFEEVVDVDDVQAFLEEVKESCDVNKYRINKSQVIEFYSKEDESFQGIAFNPELVPYDKIEIIKKNKDLKKLIKKHGLRLGSAMYFKKPLAGISENELMTILGDPDNVRYAIDGEFQIVYYTYPSGKYKFREGVLEKSMEEKVSNSSIALKR